ncbi:MAG: vitamin K epoxide reductase family protein [Thermoleophilia bacterium]
MSGALRTAVRIALVLLALVGFLISFYLTLTHYRNAVPPCYVTTGCETVVTSRYAVILGVPLSLIGTLFFALMFYLGIALVTGPTPMVLRAYDLVAFAGILAAVALFLLQAVVLKAYCSYCLATEAIALLLWAGSLVAGSAGGDGPVERGEGRRRR